MSRSSVTVQLGIHFVIFAVHLDSLCVEGQGVVGFFSSVFFVSFF